MEISVEPGKTYAVTTSGSCTVTDADGLGLCTASSGSQSFFVATTPTVTVSDNKAKVSRANFSCALARQSAGGGASADGLPAGYTRLEYLEGTGAQYIDTGIKPSAAHGLKIDHELTKDADTIPFGCRNDSGSDTRFYALRAPRMSSVGTFLGYGWGAWTALNPNAEGSRVNSELNWLNSGVAAWQGATKTLTNLPFTPSRSLYMFAANVGGVASLLSSCRVWGAAISKDSSVVASFIPALDPTGQPCMFDLVSKRALPNIGSGRFIAGVANVGALANILLALPHHETAGSILDVRLPSTANQEEVTRLCNLAGTLKNWEIVSR